MKTQKQIIKILEEEYNKLENVNARVYVLDFIKQVGKRLIKEDKLI